MKGKFVAAFFALTSTAAIAADLYEVTIEKRIDQNLYLISQGSKKLVVKTKLCLELPLREEGILVIEGPYYGNKLIFKESGESCDVESVQ